MADGNFNMFDVGQQRLEEQMFSAEKTKRDEKIFNKKVESMCIRLGMSKDVAEPCPALSKSSIVRLRPSVTLRTGISCSTGRCVQRTT